MTTEERIRAFNKLGIYISAIDKGELDTLVDQSKAQNPWFTPNNIRVALDGLAAYLDIERLGRWTSAYGINQEQLKTVGIVMAGNVPFVGFHDLLSVLISGHKALIKLSSKDSVLIPFLANKLCELEP